MTNQNYTIEATELSAAGVPIHNYYIVKDPDGNVIKELHGLATGQDGIPKPIGYLPTDQIKYHEYDNPRYYDVDNPPRSEVVFSGSLEEVSERIGYAERAGSYIFNHRLSDANLLLVKAVNELGLAPKSTLPLIEKSLKSGNKDFCNVVKNPKEVIAADQLTQKQKKVLDVLVKYCPEAIQIKVTNSSKKAGDTINKDVEAR